MRLNKVGILSFKGGVPVLGKLVFFSWLIAPREYQFLEYKESRSAFHAVRFLINRSAFTLG